MNRIGGFQLDVSLGDPLNPARVRVVLRNVPRGPEGQVFITAECASADEIEGYINAMQAELEEVRSQAQRAFREA